MSGARFGGGLASGRLRGAAAPNGRHPTEPSQAPEVLGAGLRVALPAGLEGCGQISGS